MSSPRVPSHADSDPEHTAELPVLDPAAQAAAGEHHVSQTDTLILPALAAPQTDASAPAAHAGEHRKSQSDTLILPPLAAGPAEAAPPAARLTEAPPPAGAAQAARQTELAQQGLSAKLREMQELSAMLRESQEQLAGKGARLTQAERGRDEAYAARAAAEKRAAQLNTELAQVRSELAFQLDEPTRSRAQFEEHLAQARALLNTASARADQLQRQLEEQESATRAQRAQELEQRQVAAQDRIRAAGVLSDLERERERALGYFESLQSAEGRRLILEELVS